MAVRVLLADDHKVVRQGLRMLLSLDEEFEVVGEAENGEEAVKLARELLPDVEVVALTSVLEDASVSGAVKAGAIGYLLKNTDDEELRRALKAAAAGQVQLAPEAAARLMREVRTPDKGEHQPLTERETEVLALLARGESNKQIARSLGIREKTVKTHVSAVLRKLGAGSRTQAALYAARVGLVQPGELGT